MVQSKVSKNQLQAIEVTIGLLKQLNSDERIILALYYYEELDVPAIAEVLQRPESWVEEKLNAIQDRVLQLISVGDVTGNQSNTVAAQAI